MKAPSIKMHFYLSPIKSIVRIVACVVGILFKSCTLALMGLVIAELVGVIEEIF